MLMAQMTDSQGTAMLVLSLTADTLQRLQAGEPVYCHTADMPGLADMNIAITYGESKEDAREAIPAVLPPGSTMRRMPSQQYSPAEG